MARFANEWDIISYVNAFSDDNPGLARIAQTVANLAKWANNNSDGWAYWPKPSRAASKAIEALETALSEYRRGDYVHDLADSEVTKAIAPIKSFLTRQGVDHSEVIA